MPHPRLLKLLWSVALLLPLFLATAAEATNGAGYSAKIVAARSTWVRDSKQISELLDKLHGPATTCNRLDKEIHRHENQIRRVEEELAEQLREMAEGRFCSECMRSASQLEREGEPFLHHVRKVKGTAVPASPEQFANARKSAAEKITSLRKRLKADEDERKKALDVLRSTLHELTVMIATYHRDITVEKDLQVAAWAREAEGWRKALEEHQAQLDALTRQPDTPGRATHIRAADTQMRSTLASTSAAEARARQTATAFTQAVRKDMDYLARKAGELPSGQPLLDGWFIGRSITSQNITYVAGTVRRPQASTTAQLLRGNSSGSATVPTPAAQSSISDLLKGK